MQASAEVANVAVKAHGEGIKTRIHTLQARNGETAGIRVFEPNESALEIAPEILIVHEANARSPSRALVLAVAQSRNVAQSLLELG